MKPEENAAAYHALDIGGVDITVEEAQEILRALRFDEVDAVVVSREGKERIYTLRNVGRPYRLLLESMNEGAAILSLEGRLLYINRGLCQMMGRTCEELGGLSLGDFLEEHELDRYSGILASARTERARGEFQIRSTEGLLIPVYISLTPAQVDTFHGVCVVVTDLTHQKQHQALIATERLEREARVELEEANRVKDDFLATLSHELRTPLNAILGWAQLLDKEVIEPEMLNRALDVIKRNATAQVQIIEDILDLSRISAGKLHLEVVQSELTSIVRTAVDTVQPMARGREVEIISMIDSVTPQVLVDPGRIQQVILNLLSNAIKFTPAGGRVFVRLVTGEKELVIEVEDNGEGISPDFLPFIFDRFRQKDSSYARSHTALDLAWRLSGT